MTQSLEGIGVIAAPTFRSRAYLQTLERLKMCPEIVVCLRGPEDVWDGAEILNLSLHQDAPPFKFRPGRPARETASANGWAVVEVDADDINSEAAIEVVAGLPADILIYSGMPKALLRKPLLESGKRFLHIHGGYVPAYRGATGFYYGLLEHGKLGVSAIWLDEGVDTGPLIAREWYHPIPGMDIDLVMDPAIRADLLGRLLQHRLTHGVFPSTPQTGGSESFFVIHPVLKHLALRRANLTLSDESALEDGHV